MALNIKNAEAERLVAEVASLTGLSKTAAVIDALQQRKAQVLRERDRQRRLSDIRDFLTIEVWSLPSADEELSEDALLGFGPAGA